MSRLTIFFFLLCAVTSVAQVKYPISKTVDSADIYFGNTYKDPYRWLEHLKDTSVISWFKQQANYTSNMLSKVSGRAELVAEWKMLDKLQPANIISKAYRNGKVFYKKSMPGERVAKLYYRNGDNGKEILLFDPATYVKGKILSIQTYSPSYDTKYVAIAYSQNGDEVATTKIMDIVTKKFLPDEIYPTTTILGWSTDSKSLLYLSLNSADNTDLNKQQNIKSKLHTVGAKSSEDKDFFSNVTYPELNIGSSVYPEVHVSGDKKYILANLYSTADENLMYYAPISQFNAKHIQWKLACTREEQLIKTMIIHDDKIYAMCYKGASNFKLVATSILHPDWAHAETIAAEKKDQTLEDISICRDFLLMNYSDGINHHLFKYNFRTKQTSAINLPYQGTAGVSGIDRASNACTVFIASWNKPYREFDYNALTGKLSVSTFKKPEVYPAAYTGLMAKEVSVKAHDGEMIPLSIIYRKGTHLDGNNVCLMETYGAYGEIAAPYFDKFYNSLAIKGVVIAIAHVRGGREKGDNWYRAGLKTTKPNTWRDLNSCAAYLIKQGFTQNSKLAITGTSAGGLAIARAITERPDLYAAAICNVGLANAFRFEFMPNGPGNVSEFGTVKDSIECKALYEMDGVAHVIKGTKYPAVICVSGWNDPRVIPWQPGKFAAALQNSSASEKPVLMKVNYDSGHFNEDKNVTYANFADQYAFVLWQCGHPDFQLRKQ